MAGLNYLCTMFYRRKLVLALLQLFNGHLGKIRLQKLIFLLTQAQRSPTFEFIPYKFGSFSYSLSADLSAMVKHGQIIESTDQFSKVDGIDYVSQLKTEDRKFLSAVKAAYGRFTNDELMRYTYLKFPFYAIKSLKAPELLSREEYTKVELARPHSDETILFTMGYEGISFENYLNRLIQHDVKVLVDVRNNPMSMKFGFSKSQLKKACENLGIRYIHIPEVGITSENRKQLNSQADYDKLFATYKSENLVQTVGFQESILELLTRHHRIALTCFEANICQCHRKPLAEAISKRSTLQHQLRHI